MPSRFSLTSTFTLAGGSEFGIATEKGDFGYSECISNAKACKHENRAAFRHCMVDLADGYGLPVVTVESGNADTLRLSLRLNFKACEFQVHPVSNLSESIPALASQTFKAQIA